MKRLLRLATFMLLVCSAEAQWKTNVWPAASHYRFTSTNDMVDIKDRSECYRHVQYLTVTSDIPVTGFTTNGFKYETDEVGAGY